MLTPLGKALRVLRMDRGWLLKDMADGLGWSAAFLSAIETGRKPPPSELVDKVSEWARLSNKDESDLVRAYALSVSEFKIRVPEGMSDEDREAAAVLARTFSSLPSQDLTEIRDLILRRKA